MNSILHKITICIVICTIIPCIAVAKDNSSSTTNLSILTQDSPTLLLTYTSPNTLGISVQTQGVRYRLEIQRTQDGHFLLIAPPFLEADISKILHIGEIQPQGLFTRLLDPMSGNSSSVGFIKGKNFVQNFLPSFNPKLSGFTLSMDNVDIITLGPILNSISPTGIGAIVGNSKAYTAILTATQNNILTQGYIQSFQVNWKELGYGEHMYFTLIGASSNTKIGQLTVTSGAFIQGAYDIKLGGGNTTGVELKAKTKNIQVSYENKIGGVGVKLKNLEEKANPQVKSTLKFELGEKTKIFGTHQMTTYSKPIYGGNSQERTIEYTIGLKIKKWTVTSLNSTSYEDDCGKICNTVLTAKAELDKGTVTFSTQIHRPLKGKCELRNTSLEFSNSHSNLQIKNEKVKLKLSWTLSLPDANLELSIDQNRRLTAQLEF